MRMPASYLGLLPPSNDMSSGGPSFLEVCGEAADFPGRGLFLILFEPVDENPAYPLSLGITEKKAANVSADQIRPRIASERLQ